MMRSASPALSEISVGSPSPPPTAIRPISLKRLCEPSADPAAVLPKKTKSFNIADILGKVEENAAEQPQKSTQVVNKPKNLPIPLPTALPWDITRSAPMLPPHALHSFLPPALLHYDPRLAWDYQRQLQEHFHMQAQLLRQMSLDPGIIPSEDGSERSHSNSTESDSCQSPDVSVVASQESSSSQKVPQNKEKTDENQQNKQNNAANDTPLDALFQLSTKNFDEDQDPATLNIFATRSNPKKKRKSRTAFTNHQIFELEKRFLYQKYLSPADRDEIAAGLGLSNAQVITWFQNRRAKLKRDMEELKKDVESVKQLQDQSADINHQQSNNNNNNSTQLQLLYHPQLLQTQSQLDSNHPQFQQILKNRQEMYLLQQKLQRAEQEICSDPSLNPPHHLVSQQHNACKSTIAEDKRDLKMLKMMTLMYYSSRCSDTIPIIPHPINPTAKVNN